jgi:predicted lipid-binding transport protein (Tim44 family)
MLALIGVIVAGSLASFDAEARRMGGGRSFGRQAPVPMQRNTTPAQPAPQPGQAGQAQRAQPNAAPGAAPAAAPARSRWLGPIAGLAAGLGIAALLSHFGLAGAFASAMANVIVIVLIAAVAIWLIRKIANRRRPVEPSYMTGGGGSLPSGGLRAGPTQEPRYTAPPTGQYLAPQAGPLDTPAVGAAPSVPANFDTEAFLRNAKVYFVRLQAAWDAGNIDDIREFTTPEMFAEVRVDLASRGAESNQTDVVQLNADLLGVEERDNEYFASVRFHGLIRETAGGAAEPFVEIWNLSRSRQTGDGWLLAGIQQVESH